MEFPALEQAGALGFFSSYGKKIYNPTGIFYWSARAKNEAKINATMGSAKGRASHVLPDGGDENITLCISELRNMFPNLTTEEVFPYAPEVGLPDFRKAWKEWLLHKAGDRAAALSEKINLPMVVPGITGAISICTRMFVDPGAKIVVPDKRWENYDSVFLRNVGVEVEEFPMFEGGEFNIAGLLAAVERVWQTQDCAAAIINFPNNPTGYCPPKAKAQELVDAIHNCMANTDKKLVLLFDDAYEGYVYDDNAEARSLFYFIEPSENLLPVKMDGLSKEMLWYGARVGAVTLSIPPQWSQKANQDDVLKELENKFRGMVRNTVSNSSRVAQSVACKALQKRDAVVAERKKAIDVLTRRYQMLQEALSKISLAHIEVDPFQGGFFCFINLRPESGLKASEVCDHLLKQYQVGTVPLESGDINGIRVAFCSVEEEDLPTLCESLEKAVSDLVK